MNGATSSPVFGPVFLFKGLFVQCLQEGLKNVKGESFSVQIYCNDIDMVKWVKDIGSQMILQKLQRRFKKDWTAFASTLEFVKTY